MKKFALLTLLALSMGTAQAAQKYKTVQSAKSDSTSSYSYSAKKDDGFKFEIRPGAGTAGSQFTYGINLEGKYGFKVGPGNLFAGLETGFHRGSTAVGQGISQYGQMIPIAASGNYEFAVNNKLKLYGGTSLGIGLASGGLSYDTALYGNVEGASGSTTVFVWKFRPGLVLNDRWVAELPIGTADGNFFFLPNLGVRI